MIPEQFTLRMRRLLGEEPLWLERLHKMTQELERKENSDGLFEDTA